MNGFRSIVSHALLASLLCSSALGQPAAQPKSGAPAPAAAAPAAAPQPAKSLGGVAGDRNTTLQDRVPPEQMLTLQAGTDSFPARFIADLSGLPRGAVVVLHNSGQHPSWPFTVAALIDDLPLHGWSTLSIELPAPAQDADRAPAGTTPAPVAAPGSQPTAAAPAANSPAPAAAAAGTPATGTNASADPTTAAGIEARSLARIAAALKFFADRREQNVVLLGFGSGATRAAEAVRRMVADPAIGKTDPVTTLILIAPLNRLHGLEQDLPKMLPATALPTLDIVMSSDPLAQAEAEQRRRAVLHQRERIYRRLELPPIAAAESAQHSLMVRRVRAWLQRLMDGDEWGPTEPERDARTATKKAESQNGQPAKPPGTP